MNLVLSGPEGWGRIWAVADKEVRFLLRDPRSLGVTLLLPVVLLILFGYAVSFDVKHIPLAVYDPHPSPESRDLIRALTGTDQFRLAAVLPRPAEADHALAAGSAKVVLILPRSFSADLAGARPTAIQTLINGADSLTATVSLAYLEGMIQDWAQRRLRREPASAAPALPIEPRVRIWYNEDLSSVNFITPGLVVIILMMLAALLTSQTIVREREQGTFEGLVVSPISARELIIGKMAPYVVIARADLVLVAAAGRLLFHVPLRGSPVLMLALLFIYLLAALGAGLLISVLARSQQLAYLVALIATLLPTMLLTGFIFPVPNMPTILQALVQFHPATQFMVIARSIGLKGAGLEVLWPRALALVLLAAALVGASIVRFRKSL